MLTHDLSDGDGLGQGGWGAGPRHVVGSHTELHLLPGRQVPDDDGRPICQAIKRWDPLIRCGKGPGSGVIQSILSNWFHFLVFAYICTN